MEHDIDVLKYDLSISGMMLTFHANPIHLSEALSEIDNEKVGRNEEKVGRNDEKVGRNAEKVGRNEENVGINKGNVGINKGNVEINGENVGINGENVGRNEEKVGRNEENCHDNITNNQIQILSLLIANPKLTARELSDKTGISSRKIELNIAKLKMFGYIKRIGSTKSGYWEVLK